MKLMKFVVGGGAAALYSGDPRFKSRSGDPGHVKEESLQANAGMVFTFRTKSLRTLLLTVRYSLISYHMGLRRSSFISMPLIFLKKVTCFWVWKADYHIAVVLLCDVTATGHSQWSSVLIRIWESPFRIRPYDPQFRTRFTVSFLNSFTVVLRTNLKIGSDLFLWRGFQFAIYCSPKI
jgi:hypothetical protein